VGQRGLAARRRKLDPRDHRLQLVGGSVANFKTAIGSLTVFLVLTAYVFTSAAIFLVGVQLDELLRKDVRGAK
jgi:hypothetical protein